MASRKRRPSPARTPVRITTSAQNVRTGQAEAQTAASLELAGDGSPLWTYRRTADREWESRLHGCQHGFVLARTLDDAAVQTASGYALKVIERQEAEMAATLAAVTGGAR